MLSSNLAISIADSGHRYAMMSASSGLSPAAQLTEMFSGLTQVCEACFFFLLHSEII